MPAETSLPEESPLSRRSFLHASLMALGVEASAASAVNAVADDTVPGSRHRQNLEIPAGSDLGSLYPFIQKQAISGEFPLSYLNPKFGSARTWRRLARTKVLELLHYSPASC
jgi:hypothetical protein